MLARKVTAWASWNAGPPGKRGSYRWDWGCSTCLHQPISVPVARSLGKKACGAESAHCGAFRATIAAYMHVLIVKRLDALRTCLDGAA